MYVNAILFYVFFIKTFDNLLLNFVSKFIVMNVLQNENEFKIIIKTKLTFLLKIFRVLATLPGFNAIPLLL